MKNPPPVDVFLLGAGFARAISTAMPLLQNLAAAVGKSRTLAGNIPPEVRRMMDENFAQALSYLEQPKPWVSEADNLRHRALFLEFSNAIARVLDRTAEKVARELVPRVPSWLSDLVRLWHERRCLVLTLNYDTLVERIATTVPIGSGRLTTQQLYPPLLTDAGVRTGGERPVASEPSFRLLKLHGSTNWYYSGRQQAHGEPIYFVPPLPMARISPQEEQEYRFRMNAVADKYPFLVPPVFDKTALLTHETIRAMWFEAGDAMRHARRLICMSWRSVSIIALRMKRV